MKKLFTLAVTLLAVVALTSCGNAKPNFICPDELTSDPIEVNFWHTMSATSLQPTLNAKIAEFKELYPNITVKHQQVGGYNEVRDSIITNMGTGTYPSMAYCYPDHVALYNEGTISISLDDLMQNEKYGFGGSQLKFEGVKSENDFVQAFLEEGRVFGGNLTYTLPFLKSTEALFYNETFFKANNLTVPTTWEEMWAVCARIKEIDPSSTPLGVDSEANWFITLAEQYGYDYTNSKGQFKFNNKGNKELMGDLKANFDKGYFTTQAISGGYCNVIFTDTEVSSRMYMTIGSTGGSTYQAHAKKAFTTGVAMIPQASAKAAPKAISQGPSICLFKNDNPQVVLASWLFLQYLLTDSAQAAFAIKTGYIPATTTATAITDYVEYLAAAAGNTEGISALAAKQSIAQANAYFTSAAFVGSSTARDEVGKVLIYSVNGTKSIDEAFRLAIEECEYQVG